MQQTIHYIPPIAQAVNTLRVAAYCRVSSDSADQLESYAAQLEHYNQLIDRNPNWELVDLYADEGLTGTRADTREEFQRLLSDCRRGRIDKILTKSISRFARNIRDCLSSVRELKALGVEVLFEKEKLDTGAMGSELMLSFYGAGAQEESMSISGNMRMSYRGRMKRGEFVSCKAPYGYTLIGSYSLEIDETEAPIVRRVFREFLAGISIAAIVDRLNNEGITKRGRHWARTSVEFLLHNERYSGNALLQKSYTTDEFPFHRVMNKGERTMYYIENSHSAIIDKDTFNRVQDLMHRRNIAVTFGQYPFSLMIYCGECGASFKRRVTSGSQIFCQGLRI